MSYLLVFSLVDGREKERGRAWVLDCTLPLLDFHCLRKAMIQEDWFSLRLGTNSILRPQANVQKEAITA